MEKAEHCLYSPTDLSQEMCLNCMNDILTCKEIKTIKTGQINDNTLLNLKYPSLCILTYSIIKVIIFSYFSKQLSGKLQDSCFAWC